MILNTILLCSAVISPHEVSISEATKTPAKVDSFNGIALEIEEGILDIEIQEQVRVSGFPLTKKRDVNLILERFEVFTHDAKLVLASIDEEGNLSERTMGKPEVVLLRGSIEDEPDSVVFLAVGKNTTNGWIESSGSTFVIAKDIGAQWTAIYNQNEIDPDLMNWVDINCAVDELGVDISTYKLNESERGFGGPVQCPALRIAIETDWQFTNLFGGNTDASGEYAATLIGAMSTIYELDVNVETNICYLRLWDTSADLWSGGDAGSQLNEFASYWNANMGYVERHLGHMLSGQGLGGGVAWVSAVCTSYGYAVSGNLAGSFPLPIEDHNGNNWDLMVVAHETGHNCGTLHTHDYSPPIDGCGLGDCSAAWGGTIMSYCHTCSGGMSNCVMSLHPLVQDTITNYLSGVSCSLGGDGSPPTAALDTAWTMNGEPVDIDVLSNDYPNDCSGTLQIGSYDETSHLGGTVEMIGNDPSTAVLRYTPVNVTNSIDVFNYVVLDGDGQGSTGGVLINIVFPRPPDNPAATESGVVARYYALDNPSNLPDFSVLEPISEEVISDINYASTNGNFAGSGLSNDVGAVFEGFIEVESDGFYIVYVNSDDGSRLYIGDNLLVENDGLHGMHEESGEILLAAGLHSTRIEFFERGGGAGCIVSISGAGLPKQVVSADMYSHEVSVYGDITGDGVVDIEDLLILISAWGSCDLPCAADIDGNGVVDIADLLELVAQWT